MQRDKFGQKHYLHKISGYFLDKTLKFYIPSHIPGQEKVSGHFQDFLNLQNICIPWQILFQDLNSIDRITEKTQENMLNNNYFIFIKKNELRKKKRKHVFINNVNYTEQHTLQIKKKKINLNKQRI